MAGRPRRTLRPILLALIVILGVAVDPGSGQPSQAAIGGAPADSLAEYFLTKISAGNKMWCAVNEAGAVKCAVTVGSPPNNNQYGQVGNGTTTEVSANQAYQVVGAGTSNVQQVAVGNQHACLLKNDGTVWCWGGQYNGSSYVTSSSPVRVTAAGGEEFSGVVRIDTGYTMNCAIKGNGEVWCWGHLPGGLGVDSDPNPNYRPEAVKVTGVSGAIAVAVGSSAACALLNDTKVKCWGQNRDGQLGRTTEFSNNQPARYVEEADGSYLSGVRSVAGKLYTFCVLTNAQQVRCWGSNQSGVVGSSTDYGVGAVGHPAAAITFPDGADITSIALSSADGMAVATDGTAYYWGGLALSPPREWTSPVAGAQHVAIAASGTSLFDSCRVLNDAGNVVVTCPMLVINGDGSGLDFPDFPFPSPPSIDGLTVGASTATVTLSATSGGTPTHFEVTASAQAPGTGVVSVTCPVGDLCIIPGLVAGVTYTLEATASNANGVSGPSFWSNGATFTPGPIAPPLAPLLEAGDQTVTISPQPGDGGTPSRYIVFLEPGGRSCEVINPATSCAIDGLTNGNEYTVTTSAMNETGESDPSEPATVIIGPAAPPLVPTVVIDDRQATVTINPSATISADTPGGTPSYYTVTAQPGDHTCRVTPPATSCLLENLTNGVDYTFETTATNGTGTTSASPTITTLVEVLPHSPQGPHVVIAPDGVTVSSIPAITGGSVSTITVSARPSNPVKFCAIEPPATECFIAGLDASTLYTFEAVAGNQLGESQPAITPALIAPPAPPSIDLISLDSTSGVGSLTVTVSADTGTDGGPPADFRIYAFEQPSGPLRFCDVSLPDSSCTIGGLTPGLTYTVTASAENELGTSGTSEPTEVSLIPPLAPHAPSVISIAHSEATVSVNPNTLGAPASFYMVTASAAGHPDVSCTVTPPATSCRLAPLVDGVTYEVITTASNVFGTSPHSDLRSLFLGPPAEPPAPLVTPGDGQATVTVGPGEGGGIPSSYLVIVTDPDGVEVARCTVTPPPTTCVLTPLTNGVEYTVSLSATNDFGTTTGSATTTVTPRAAPTGILPGLLPPVAPVAPSTPVPADPGTGRLPEPAAGEVTVVTDGQPTTVTVVVENQTDLVVRNADFELRLIADCASLCPITTDESGRQIIQLDRNGSVRVSGRGFLPGSPVLVWLFSNPRLLGELTVADDGTFAGTLPIGVLEPGLHTLQVNGVSMDNTLRTANLGVMVMGPDVVEPSVGGELPATGKDLSVLPAQLIILALCFFGLGWLLRNPAATRRC